MSYTHGETRPVTTTRLSLLAILLPILWIGVLAQQPARPPSAPDAAAARETFLRVCVKCHTAERITAQGRTREQWEEVLTAMRGSRGAVFSDEEFEIVATYLTREFGPASTAADPAPAPGAQGRATQPAGGGRGPRAHVGAADRHRVDAVASARGRKTYAAECVTCHGPSARGGDDPATNLVRSTLMLRDRYGSAIGPLLRKGHPMQTARTSASLTDAEITDLSHYIWDRINDTLQGSPPYTPKSVLTGDVKAGEMYFTSAGRCTECHSVTGDLAGYGKRYSPVDIQTRFVFPSTSGGRGSARKPVTVTVTPPGGAPVSGTLLMLDDFSVALRDAGGGYRSWTRSPGMTIVKTDPYAAHIELLERLTDKAMHDVVAYLESLK
jgi:mono/diheme cytochrome c family protein